MQKKAVAYLFSIITLIGAEASASEREFVYTADGRNGRNASSGSDGGGSYGGGGLYAFGYGGGYAGSGESGRSGTNASQAEVGEAAGNIELELAASPLGGLRLRGNVTQGSRSHPIADEAPLSSDLTIRLSAQGGRGGDGGDGGDGGRGGDGHAGEDASRFHAGTSGGNGGDGGDAGDGSDGRWGGAGGRVTISVNEDDADLLWLLEGAANTRGGDGGKAGHGGRGGEGGHGGRGGNSYSWSDSHYGYRGAVYYTHHSNPGGADGSYGRRGRDGSDGSSGRKGPEGEFHIRLYHGNGTPGSQDAYTTYRGIYALEVIGIELEEQNNDGRLEPGEKIAAWITVKNTGLMPTPERHDISVGLVANQWIASARDEHAVLGRSLRPGEELRLATPLHFSIPHPDARQVPARAVHESLRFDFRFQVGRNPKPIHHHPQGAVTADMRAEYPVVINAFVAPASIGPGEEAPLVWKLTNTSQKALGAASESARHLSSRIIVKGAARESLIFRDANGQELPLTTYLEQQLASLAPRASVILKGTVAFPSTTPDQSRAELGARLTLAAIDDGRNREIQEESLSVQYEQGYNPAAAADVLLVINHRVGAEEVRAWQELLGRLNLRTQLWNLSYYQGLDFDYAVQAGQALADNFTGKLILVLDYGFAEELGAPASQALNRVKFRQLFDLLKRPGLASYIVSSATEQRLPLWPLSLGDDCQHSYDSVADFLKAFSKKEAASYAAPGRCDRIWVKPKGHDAISERVEEKIEKLSEALADSDPDKNFLFVHDDTPATGPASIQVIRLLDASDDHLSVRAGVTPGDQAFIASDENLHFILWALPFNYKLRLWDAWLGRAQAGARPELLDRLTEVLLHELFAEQALFRGRTGTGQLDDDYVEAHLTKLATLASVALTKANYPPAPGDLRAEAYLAFAQRLDARLQGAMTSADRWLPSRRQRLVTKESESLLRKFLGGVFVNIEAGSPGYVKAWEKAMDKIWKDFEKLRKNEARASARETLQELREARQFGGRNQPSEVAAFHATRSREDYQGERARLNALGHEVKEGTYDFNGKPEKRRALLEEMARRLGA